MSKSLGNFFTVREILKKYEPEVVRFFIVRAHYRSPLNYSDKHLDDARGALTRLYTTLKNVPPGAASVDWNEPYAIRFRVAMDDDFNTADAVAVLFDLANEVNRDRSPRTSGILKALGATLGLLQDDPNDFLQGRSYVLRAETSQMQLMGHSPQVRIDYSPSKIDDLILQRSAARKLKNFAEADRIRDELQMNGIMIEDSRDGCAGWRKGTGLRLVHLDDLEDFQTELRRRGYRVEDFRIKEKVDVPPPSAEIYAIRGTLEFIYLPTGKKLTVQAGHGTAWIADIEEKMKNKYFEN